MQRAIRARLRTPSASRTPRSKGFLLISQAIVVATLVGLTLAGTIAGVARGRRWVAAANRICAGEQARLASLEARRADTLEALRLRIRIERRTVTSLQRLTPAAERTSLEQQFIAWREYELGVDQWLLEALPRNDPRIATTVSDRATAHERSRALARQAGASTCARV